MNKMSGIFTNAFEGSFLNIVQLTSEIISGHNLKCLYAYKKTLSLLCAPASQRKSLIRQDGTEPV